MWVATRTSWESVVSPVVVVETEMEQGADLTATDPRVDLTTAMESSSLPPAPPTDLTEGEQ